MRGSKAKRLRRELNVDHPGRLQEERFRPSQDWEQKRAFVPRSWRRKMRFMGKGRKKIGDWSGGD